jgi:hypothetical protein
MSVSQPLHRNKGKKWDGISDAKTHLVIFHPRSLPTFFPSLMLTPHRLVTTISNLGKYDNSANAIPVTPNWNLKNKNFKHGNTSPSPFALLFHVRITSSSSIEVSLVEEEDPVILRDTKLGRVEREVKEEVGVVIVDMRVRWMR